MLLALTILTAEVEGIVVEILTQLLVIVVFSGLFGFAWLGCIKVRWDLEKNIYKGREMTAERKRRNMEREKKELFKNKLEKER